MTVPEMNKLSHEIERLLRELRGGTVAGEASADLQTRQRRIQRLNSALTMLRAHRVRIRR